MSINQIMWPWDCNSIGGSLRNLVLWKYSFLISYLPSFFRPFRRQFIHSFIHSSQCQKNVGNAKLVPNLLKTIKYAKGWFSGARLTKAYDVTIQRYRNSHAKIHDSKMHILRCMGSKFCVKFQRCPLKSHTKFWTHTPQNMHFMRW